LLASARARRTFLAYPLAYGYLVLALVPIVLAFVVVGLLTGDFDRGDVRPWTVLLEWAGGWFLPAVGAVGLFAVWRCLVAAADEVDGDRRRPFSHLAWLQRERTKTGERA
jgi:hypothetical protein